MSASVEVCAWSARRVIAKAQRPWGGCLDGMNENGLTHVPAKWNPVRQGEPLFADKDMRQQENLRRIPFILDHSVIQYERDAL
jgi:hypothetical protein